MRLYLRGEMGQEGFRTKKGERKKQARVGVKAKREEEDIVFSLGRVPLLLETMSSEREPFSPNVSTKQTFVATSTVHYGYQVSHEHSSTAGAQTKLLSNRDSGGLGARG